MGPIFLPIYQYMGPNFPTELVTNVKPSINSVDVHPQVSKNKHPVDGALVGTGSLWRKQNILRFCSFVTHK
jgi:hypothetical protein